MIIQRKIKAIKKKTLIKGCVEAVSVNVGLARPTSELTYCSSLAGGLFSPAVAPAATHDAVLTEMDRARSRCGASAYVRLASESDRTGDDAEAQTIRKSALRKTVLEAKARKLPAAAAPDEQPALCQCAVGASGSALPSSSFYRPVLPG